MFSILFTNNISVVRLSRVTQYFLENFFHVFSPKSITVRKLDIDPSRRGVTLTGLHLNTGGDTGLSLVGRIKVTRSSGDKECFYSLLTLRTFLILSNYN